MNDRPRDAAGVRSPTAPLKLLLAVLLTFAACSTTSRPASAQNPTAIPTPANVAVLQNSASANGDGTTLAIGGYQVVTVSVSTTGSPTFTVTFKTAVSRSSPATTATASFSPIQCTPLDGSAATTTAAATGQFRCIVAANTDFLAPISGFSGSGTVTVIAGALAGTSSISTGSGGSGGSSSTFGAAFPSTGTAAGASDGTNMVALRAKGASTAAVATDPSLVVALSPNSPIPAGAAVIGAVTQSGTWTVQPGNTANTTPWLVTPKGAQDSGGGDMTDTTLHALGVTLKSAASITAPTYSTTSPLSGTTTTACTTGTGGVCTKRITTATTTEILALSGSLRIRVFGGSVCVDAGGVQTTVTLQDNSGSPIDLFSGTTTTTPYQLAPGQCLDLTPPAVGMFTGHALTAAKNFQIVTVGTGPVNVVTYLRQE